MAFDAGMVFALTRELDLKLGEKNGLGGSRIDKIAMPERDEVHLILHSGRDTYRLVVSASSSNPRLHLTDTPKENPNTPPSFCMLLRKHLTASRLMAIRQIEFERVIELEFDFRDELGYMSKKFLMLEILGKHSNMIFCDGEHKILGAVRTTDLSDSLKRAVIVGMKYALPPPQDKISPIGLTKDKFLEALSNFDPNTSAEKVLTTSFLGVSSLISREAVYRSTGDALCNLSDCDKDKLFFHFSSFYDRLLSDDVTPTLVCRTESPDIPFEYAFIEIRQYENKAVTKELNSISDLINTFFSSRDKADRIKQRSQDIFHLLLKSQNRLLKKIEVQEEELRDSQTMEESKRCADLIMQEIYRIKRGDTKVVAIDYSKEDYPEVTVELDSQLSPSANAQRYYKKYNRKKNAAVELKKQIESAKDELKYIDAVLDSLSRAESESDLDELRRELSEWGYGKRDMKKLKNTDKKSKPKPLRAISPSGLEIYIGKNNLQNDYLTTKFADKKDWWFHVKNLAGSHVIMRVEGEEPPAEDFTFAASLAALYSSAEGENIAVDYTLIKHIKKPPQAKPGFVTYSTYWTAFVTPDREELKKVIIK